MRFLTLCAGLSLVLGASVRADEPLARPGVRPYEGRVVVRVSPSTAEQLAAVEKLAEGVMSERLAIGPVDLIVPRERLADLHSLGLTTEILVEDLQARADAERDEIESLQRAERDRAALTLQAGSGPHDLRFWDRYHNRAEVEAYLFALAAAYPDLATLQQIGISVQGTPIWSVLISAPDSPSNPRSARPVVLFNGTQHAREWISTSTVLYLADRLLAEHESNPRLAGLLQTTEFAIVPLANPDGYDHTWGPYRYWRKNRRNNGDGTYGVDLNRNWSFEWGGAGSSGTTSNDLYRGPSPFSEPESTAVSNLALSFGPRLAGGIDFHSYGRLVLWPWGYSSTAVLTEPDLSIISALSIDMAGTIDDMSGELYTPEQAAEIGAGAGAADDWLQGATPGFGMTIELRTNVFDPAREHVLACAVETLPAALHFAEGVSQAIRIEPTSPIPAAADHGTPLTLEIRAMNAMGLVDTATPTLHVRYAGASSETAIAMTPTGPSTFAAQITPPNTRGRTSVRFTASSTLGDEIAYPASGSFEISTRTSETTSLLADDFETDLGWTVGSSDDDATAGLWSRGDPSLAPNHPAADTTAAGTLCYVTGLAAGDDVDTGYTRLVSPSIAVPPQAGDVLVSADLWRRTSNTEPLLVELAPDNTDSWTTALVFWPADQNWHRRTLRVGDFISPASSFRVRFSAMDLPNDSTTEAAVDGVRVDFAPFPSPADVNGDGVIDNGDIAAFITLFLQGDPAVDFNADGVIDNGDIAAFLTAFLLG